MNLEVHNPVDVTVTQSTKAISSPLLMKCSICTFSAQKCIVCFAYLTPSHDLKGCGLVMKGMTNWLTVLN